MKVKSGFLTLIGLPNAGKSSLLNALVGQTLSIVTPKAQTTRQILKGFVAAPDLELVVVDTPGLQDGTKALNETISRNAALAVKNASQGKEIVGLVIDASDIGARLREKRHLGLDRISNAFKKANLKLPLPITVLPILNKMDLVRKQEFRDEIEKAVASFLDETFQSRHPFFWISAKANGGDHSPQALLEKIKENLDYADKGLLFEEDTLSDQNLRDFASEFIREQCFLQLGEELPYAIAIRIDQFKEEEKITRIDATVFVERDSQKAMVIGKSAEKIKAIGTKSRAKIEELLDKKVFLALKVKVSPHWTQNQTLVDRFGYNQC